MTAAELRPPAEAPGGIIERSENTRLFWAAIALVASIKISVLVLVDPTLTPDSLGYIAFAEAILDHGRAFAPVAWGAEAAPAFIFRPPGYPLFLVAVKLISANGFATVAVLVQGAVNLATTYLMFRVATRLLRSRAAALVAVLLYAGSTSLLWDNAVLSDSLFASLWNAVIFALLGHLVGCWRLKLHHFAGLGLLWGYSLWLRDVGLYFTIVPAVLFVSVVLRERAHRTVAAAGFGLFLLVSCGFAGAIVLLNLHRTGEAFFSITGMENWWRPGFDMARFGYAQPYTGDDLVSTVARETMPDNDPGKLSSFYLAFHKRCGCTPTQMQAIAFATFRSAVTRYPLAYARVVLKNFNYFALGELLADPVATLNTILEFGAGRPGWRLPGLSVRHLASLRADFAVGTLAAMLIVALGEVISAVVFSAYFFGTPYLLLRAPGGQGGVTDERLALGFLWVSFVAVAAMLSLVHFEARYALPTFPAAAVGIVDVACRLRRWRRHGAREAAA
jgi:hypothetical protein